MDSEDLKFVAEALIALCQPDPDRPCYEDADLIRKERARLDRDALWRRLSRHRPSDPLLQRECQEILTEADLTDRQAIILQLRLDGVSFDEIGYRHGGSKQSVRSGFIHALKKLRRAILRYPYLGISDTYRQETRRTCY